MEQIGLRCYVDSPLPEQRQVRPDGHNNSLVLVFDTETTNDEYQNLLFGSCGVWRNGRREQLIIFYNDRVVDRDAIDVIKAFAQKNGFKATTREEFVDTVFFPLVFRSRAICVGFNLPFDLSRLAMSTTFSRKMRNGFSLILSNQPSNPRIVIKSLDSKRSFIEFINPLRKKSESQFRNYRGYFVDLRTLMFALTNESYSLERAAKILGCKHQKTHIEKFGVIDEQALAYNVNDVLTTYDVYQGAIKRYQLYGLNKEPNRLYSPASIGKAYLEKMGVRPFLEKNPEFPKSVLGFLMSAYYGGRAEVKIRKQPTKITYIDFTSMYPTLYVLLGMDRFLKSDKIECKENTRKIQDLLYKVTQQDLQDQSYWKLLPCICRIKPQGDILPARARYGNKNVYNIGVNNVDSEISLWYALPDLIASKFLSGKTPIIEEAISFEPIGVQEGLKEITILNDIVLSPQEDFIKKLIEERLKQKAQKAGKTGVDKEQIELKQKILKIIANSASYGIFIEVNTSETKGESREVYGLHQFSTQLSRIEDIGRAFNPIMAVTITAGSRLILAIAESLVNGNGGKFAYCDTDSVFITPDQVQTVQDFFKPLNPYNVPGLEMFKIEEDDEGNILNDVWFYGISAKRYVLYDYDPSTGFKKIRKHSSHGLGHLLNVDHIKVWEDIIDVHYRPEQKENIIAKYGEDVAVSQLTISGFNIQERFKELNKGKPFEEQIKPFNFVLVGTGYRTDQDTGEMVIPMMPYINPKDKRFTEVPYRSFVDYKSGKYYHDQTVADTHYYWKPLSEVIQSYLDHPESKSQGEIGALERKLVSITGGSIDYIGKETNSLEESMVTGVDEDQYTLYNKESLVKEVILSLTEEEASRANIPKRTLRDWRAKIREEKHLNLKTGMEQMLIRIGRCKRGDR